MAPQGPPSALSLPASHTGAFQTENYPIETSAYLHFGALALQRQRLSKLPLVYNDNQNQQLDTGIPPIGDVPLLFSMRDLNPGMNTGAVATLGFLWGNQSFEVSGFYIPEYVQRATFESQGSLFVPFNVGGGFETQNGRIFLPQESADNLILGFEGNLGIFNQADYVQVRFKNELANIEANYRIWNGGISSTDLLMGVRYFRAVERIEIFGNDDFLIRNVLNNSDPNRAATYSSTVRNNLVAFQLGGEFSTPCPVPYLNFMHFTATGKAAMGANCIERTQKLERADGFVGIDQTTTAVRLGGILETAGYVDFHFLERMRLRAGYVGMWTMGMTSAASQIEFDLASQGRRSSERSTIFYHGPQLELQFLF
jgi:hypothetical protein